ncbi:MAG: DNA polymerase III subunit delta [Gammaproteobacteria bacterium]
MKLRLEQLAAHLAKPLRPIYVISGEEPFQREQAVQLIRQAAQQQAYTDRQSWDAGKDFDWQQLQAAAAAMSLFAERRLLEVRLPSAKPGDSGAKCLRAYADNPVADNVLLLILGKLDAAQLRSKWLTALEQTGVLVQVWPVELSELPGWIRQRMQLRGLRPSPAAVQLLAERIEGNLLAADQEMEKLLLLNGPGDVDADAVLAAVSDSARFDAFAMIDAALQGQAQRAARMAYGLRSEGLEVPVVVGALAYQTRQLCQLAAAVAAGQQLEQVFAQFRIWPKKQAPIKAALQRHSAAQWQALHGRLAAIDRSSKGFSPGRAWDELVQLLVEIAGSPLLTPPRRHGQGPAATPR